jgi:membrane protease YdiL (CAAX protease family)
MQTYLKTRPVGAQFFIFLSLVLSGLLILVGMIGTLVVMKLTGVSLAELQNPDGWNEADARYLYLIRLLLAVQFVGLFLAPVLVFAYLSDPKPARYLGLRKAPLLFFVVGILVMIAAIPLSEYLGFLNQRINFPDGIEDWLKKAESQAQRQTLMLLQKRSVSDLLLNIVIVAGFAGIGEELFFRGVLQRLAIWGFKNVWLAIIVTAFLFSALHLQFYGFFPRFLLGILLGAIYWYSGSLWPAIVAHFLYDALLITLAYFNPQLITDEQAPLITAAPLTVTAFVSAVVTAGLLVYMHKKSTADLYRFNKERSLNEPESFTFGQ